MTTPTKQPKLRQHNEHFRTVSLGGRKSCPTCGAKLQVNAATHVNAAGLRESIWSWGEYHNAKWHTVKHFCKECFDKEVRQPLLKHQQQCDGGSSGRFTGCFINLVNHDWVKFPDWLKL